MVVAADPDCHRRRLKTKLIAMGMDAANDGRYDRVIVEPSGIYDVDEFFDILYEEPLDRFYEIGNVIAIVDAGLSDNLSKESDYLLVSQIAEAGMVVFSKVGERDRVSGKVGNGDESAFGKETGDIFDYSVQNVITHMNRALEKFRCKRRYEYKMHTADEGVVEDLSNEDACRGRAGEDVLAKLWDNLTADDFDRIENCGYVPEDHIKMHVTEGNGYKSLFYYHVNMPGEELKRMAAGLFADNSLGNIYRIKGFVPVDDHAIGVSNLDGFKNDNSESSDNSYIQINATREYTEITHTDNGQEVLIVIGEGLDNEGIEKYIRLFSHEEDITAGQSNHVHRHG